jgi:translation elongation factor P/translation initiation factor 5A
MIRLRGVTRRIDLVGAQFTYKDGDMYVFMDMETYEETRLPEVRVCGAPSSISTLQQRGAALRHKHRAR